MARFTLELEGLESFERKTKALSGLLRGYNLKAKLRPVFYKWGNKLRNELVRNMKSTSRASWYYKRRSVIHHPSSPGYPPAIDTGQLIANILFGVRPFEFEFGIGGRVKYGVMLEDGTRKMAARPFIVPLIEKYEENILDDIASAVGFGGSTRSGGLVATFNRVLS